MSTHNLALALFNVREWAETDVDEKVPDARTSWDQVPEDEREETLELARRIVPVAEALAPVLWAQYATGTLDALEAVAKVAFLATHGGEMDPAEIDCALAGANRVLVAADRSEVC